MLRDSARGICTPRTASACTSCNDPGAARLGTRNLHSTACSGGLLFVEFPTVRGKPSLSLGTLHLYADPAAGNFFRNHAINPTAHLDPQIRVPRKYGLLNADPCSKDGSIFGRAHSPNPKLPKSEAASMSRVEDAERLRLQCASNVARSEAGLSSGQHILSHSIP